MLAVRPSVLLRSCTSPITSSSSLRLNLLQTPRVQQLQVPYQGQLRAGIPRPNIRMTSSTSTAPLQEWLVIIPDFVGALGKRVAVRPKHIEGLKEDREDMWLWGGAMLEEPIQPGDTNPPKMKGSAMLIGAKTKEEVIERVKKDIYVSEGVWDVSKIQIIPFRSALRKAL